MPPDDLRILIPLVITAAIPVALLILLVIHRHHGSAAIISVVGFAAALIALMPAFAHDGTVSLLVVDPATRYFSMLILSGAIATALLAAGYLHERNLPREEFYLLLSTATLGSLTLVAASHFAALFLGLEILSVSLYGMIAYTRELRSSLEAGLKYLIMAAASSAFLVFGLALIYSQTGRMTLAGVATAASLPQLVGLGLMIVGVGFKLAVVPFHMWTPDVYEGAPPPVAAFVATVSKGAMLAFVLRLFAVGGLSQNEPIVVVFWIIAIASMVAGNILALLQNNVRRILAYSSIAHLGYMLVALLAADGWRTLAVGYYLAAYFATMFGAFAVITVCPGMNETETIEDFRGLFWRRPWLTLIFTAVLLSLAGIPLTAGFVGKFLLVAAGADSDLWTLTIVLILSSVVGLYYYLRIVAALFQRPLEVVPEVRRHNPAAAFVLGVVLVLLIVLGIFPGPMIGMIGGFGR